MAALCPHASRHGRGRTVSCGDCILRNFFSILILNRSLILANRLFLDTIDNMEPSCLVCLVNIIPSDSVDTRHGALLEAAVAVFARYGYRKTSMEEVARAAGVSRQGLYLSFSNKEELFRRALSHSLRSQLNAAVGVLQQSDLELEQRLVAACDAWAGRFVGALGEDATDLMCASSALAASTVSDYETRFEQAVAAAIAASPVAAKCSKADLCPTEVARSLHATARGLKHSVKSRQDFVKGMTVAVRMVCALAK
jgi:AcrR family transcriptional regulator